jgi:hypothetical protein
LIELASLRVPSYRLPLSISTDMIVISTPYSYLFFFNDPQVSFYGFLGK